MSETKLASRSTWRSLVVLLAATLGAGALVGFLTQRDSAFTRG